MPKYNEPKDEVLDEETEEKPVSEMDDKSVKKKKEDNEEKKKQKPTSFYQDEQYVFEQISRDSFLRINKESGNLDEVKSYETDEGVIVPVNASVLDKKMVLLPSEPKFHKDDKKLKKRVKSFIHKWLDIEDFEEEMVYYYAKMSWVYDFTNTVPYLRAMADYGSGKTRFIQTVGSICYKPMFLAGASSDSFLFRMIDLFAGTMVINELERINTDIAGQITNILNNGYEKGMAVGRTEGDRKKMPTAFDVFSPKIMSTREPFKDLALESRIITVNVVTTERNDIPIEISGEFWKEAENIRNYFLGYRIRRFLEEA